MAAYDKIISVIKNYFIDMGYNIIFINDFFCEKNFKEIISIRLANANIVIRNKTDRSSHQTHIAITGEAISFFYNMEEFTGLSSDIIENRIVKISTENLNSLNSIENSIFNTNEIELISGNVTIGKRTQKQLQFSKRSRNNGEHFNRLRLGLFENDLLILLKNRQEEFIFAIGIPQIYYLDYIPDYVKKYETNTYLRIPYKKKFN